MRPAPYDPELMAAVTDLGSALRALVDASVRTAADAVELHAAAAEARALEHRLAAVRRPDGQLPSLDDLVTFRRVYNPVSGVGSALAPPLELAPADGGVVGTVVLGLSYEGPPGYAHGGMSALLLDQLLGSATIAAGLWGMTARLEVDYRRPVPLDTELLLRARVSEDAGRRSVVVGTISLADDAERPLVEGRGVFVMPRTEAREAYFAAITDSSGRHTPPGRPTDATALRGNWTPPTG
jgi:acyl-coenzyme A thioesterase PaaI-like protein